MNTRINDIRISANSSSGLLGEEKQVWAILEEVMDPEIPVLSITDLGIVREVRVNSPDPEAAKTPTVFITITPTYSGCPAMDMITTSIRIALFENGYSNTTINTVVSPAWTTDWMTERGKAKLRTYGIAPPQIKSRDSNYLQNLPVECPRCNSKNTRSISEFGSTSCKALFQCNDCKEPFDYFKCH